MMKFLTIKFPDLLAVYIIRRLNKQSSLIVSIINLLFSTKCDGPRPPNIFPEEAHFQMNLYKILHK